MMKMKSKVYEAESEYINNKKRYILIRREKG